MNFKKVWLIHDWEVTSYFIFSKSAKSSYKIESILYIHLNTFLLSARQDGWGAEKRWWGWRQGDHHPAINSVFFIWPPPPFQPYPPGQLPRPNSLNDFNEVEEEVIVTNDHQLLQLSWMSRGGISAKWVTRTSWTSLRECWRTWTSQRKKRCVLLFFSLSYYICKM